MFTACTGDAVCVASVCRATSPFGGGEDGDAEVLADADLSATSLSGRSTPEHVSFRVASFVDASSMRLATTPTGLVPGDEVLVITLRGGRGGGITTANVGNWETRFVSSIVTNIVTLHAPLTLVYGDSASDLALTRHVVAMMRIPRYRTLRVAANQQLVARTFQVRPAPPGNNTIDATYLGGVLPLRVSGDVVVEAGARITMTSRGYRGGPTGVVSDQDAQQGEGRAGFGPQGDTSASNYNDNNGLRTDNYGGGGAYVTGAGGGHVTAGSNSAPWTSSVNPAVGGSAYGVTGAMPQVFLGGGGGGVWNGNNASGCSLTVGPGANGGGILMLWADSVVLNGRLAASGEIASSGASGANRYGAGGGAGGTVRVHANTITMNPGAEIRAVGGAGLVPQCTSSRAGGNGGDGAIRLLFNTFNGVPWDNAMINTTIGSYASPAPLQVGPGG